MKLKFVGDGSYRPELESDITRLGLGDRVTILGEMNKEQVLAEIDSSNVLVSSSYKETFGLVAVESLLRSRPIICTESGGPELFVDASNGLVSGKPGDVEGLATALRKIYDGYSDYDKSQIRKDAEIKFSEQSILKIVEGCYLKTIAG